MSRDHQPTRKNRWKVAEAKARLAQMLSDAKDAPQVIENRGDPVAVVVGIDEYRRLRAAWEEASPAARWQRFMRISEEMRDAGGADLDVGERRPRPSPLEGDAG